VSCVNDTARPKYFAGMPGDVSASGPGPARSEMKLMPVQVVKSAPGGGPGGEDGRHLHAHGSAQSNDSRSNSLWCSTQRQAIFAGIAICLASAEA
jgi:hypothetical protein